MILILGGGLSGLQLGRRLQERGIDFIILESKDAVGGLCRTMERGDYSWDLGPHGFYSKRPEAMDDYRDLPLDFRSLERNVRVCHHGSDGRIHEVNYPFENGIAELPLAHKLECVAGYCWASWTHKGRGFRDLRHWIVAGLGRGIARHFMLPYNEKIWDCALERISMDLVKQKIEPERPWAVMRHAFVAGSVGRVYQSRFIYPVKGGAGAIADAVAGPIRSRIRTGAPVRTMRPSSQGWRVGCGDGTSHEASSVVSTIPLPELLDAMADADLSRHREAFAFNDTHFVVIGLKRGRDFARFRNCQWVFFAGPETFYRVTLMHNFSSARPPTIVAEITRKGGSSARSEDLIRQVEEDLIGAGIIGAENDVGFTHAWLERYTYPIQTLELGTAREAVERRLQDRRLFLLGRMGRWEYINTDGVFLGVDEFLKTRGEALARGTA